MEPTVLLGLTVATVKSPRRKVQRRGRLDQLIRIAGCEMSEWLSNLPPWELYLIAGPRVGLGAILFFNGIIQLLEPPRREDRP
jgi:hypothetical protein